MSRLVKIIPQERISERMCEQSEVIEVTGSSQDQSWQRTAEQILDDTRHDPTSRICDRIREQKGVLSLFEKKRKEGKQSFYFCCCLNIVCLLRNEGVLSFRLCASLFLCFVQKVRRRPCHISKA